MIEWIEGQKHPGEIQEKPKEFLIVLFYASFPSGSKSALAQLERFTKEDRQVPIYVIDVAKVKGVHKQVAVDRVPTVLALRKGKATQRLKGVERIISYLLRMTFWQNMQQLTKSRNKNPYKQGLDEIAYL